MTDDIIPFSLRSGLMLPFLTGNFDSEN